MSAPVLQPGVFRKGQPGFIEPGSDLHSVLLSPSKVAAVLGVSRWESAYRLWHRMKGITPPEPDRDDFRVGHAFESTLAYLWCGENPGWQLSRGEVQIVGDASRFGFPFVVTLDRQRRRGSSRGAVEFKTCRGWEEWGSDDDEAPPDYLLQVLSQMLLSGLTKLPANLSVLNKIGCGHRTYTVEFNPEIGDMLIEECRAFWLSLQSDSVPPLDDSVATYECVREQHHPHIDKGAEVQIPAELANEYHAALDAENEAKTRSRFAKTQVLDLMARANYAVVGDVRVARRQPSTRDSVALFPIKPKEPAA